MVRRYGIGPIASVLAVVVMWSTTFAGNAAALKHFTPGNLLFVRWSLTVLLFVIYAAATRMRLPEKRDVPAFALAGLLGFGVYQLLLVFGQTGVSASMAGFLVNMNPVFTMLIAVALGRDRATAFTWIGLAVCMGGLVLMGAAKGSFTGSPMSMVLIVLAALSFATYTVISKPLYARYTPMQVSTYSIVAGCLPFLAFAPGSLRAVATATPAQLGVVLFMALVPGGIAYVLWSRSIAVLPPGLVARLLYLVPVVGVAVSWAWIGEAPHALTIAGGLVTLAGVAVAGVRSVPVLEAWRPGAAAQHVAAAHGDMVPAPVSATEAA
jgi:drug/metabolite transporter (DMT)-like permease